MLCIQTRTTLSDERRMKMEYDEFYFKSGDEMMKVFGTEAPDAITNTLAVAEQCDVTIGYENHYPNTPRRRNSSIRSTWMPSAPNPKRRSMPRSRRTA